MYKIKLLILLPISLCFLSCSTNNIEQSNYTYSIGYIAGEYDGLVLSDLLNIHLKSNKLLNRSSIYEIRANINHTANIYITNIDNTSNRERVITKIDIKIFDKKTKCNVYSFVDDVSNFYVFASSDKFISNQNALKRIKFDNTETIVKNFLNSLTNIKIKKCVQN